MTVYVDGVKLGENASLSAKVERPRRRPRRLPRHARSTAATASFQGWYDNVRVYNRALSQAEVLANAGVEDQLLEVSLTQPEALKVAPIVDARRAQRRAPGRQGHRRDRARADVLDRRGRDRVAGERHDRRPERAGGVHPHRRRRATRSSWTIEARVVNSPVLPGPVRRPEHRGVRRHVLHLRHHRRLPRLGRQGVLRLEVEEPRRLGALGRAVPHARRRERQRAVGDRQRVGADDHRARREVLLLLLAVTTRPTTARRSASPWRTAPRGRSSRSRRR